MIVHRSFKYRLYGTEEQEALFRQFAGVCRLVYNLALEQPAITGGSTSAQKAADLISRRSARS